MRNWDATDEAGESVCTGDSDAAAAKLACEELGISFKTVDFVAEYWNEVFEPFLDAYSEGITPNPDISCNRYTSSHVLASHPPFLLPSLQLP
jgi:tRNA U34 2-thiouridine synthase MnmA/TrmU